MDTQIQPAMSRHERPNVTVDTVILGLRDHGLEVILMRRASTPFSGCWALPGGYIHMEEDVDLEAAARRILRDKTGVIPPYVEQLQAFGSRDRDPRGWTATFTYFALIPPDSVCLESGANADAVQWWRVEEALTAGLAFDHADILACAINRLRNKVQYSTLPVHLLPQRFTLSDLQRVYERLLDKPMDKSAFRKRIAEVDFLEAIPGEMRRGSNRPAQLYRLRPGAETVFFDRLL